MSAVIVTILVVVLAVVINPAYGMPLDARAVYLSNREKFINCEQNLRLGANVTLNAEEQRVNCFVKKQKMLLMQHNRLNRTEYIPAASFFKSKSFIESTPLYQMIKKMPKGASLHLHDLAITSLDWVVKNATYRDNVYMCVDDEYFIRLGAFQTPPTDDGFQWKLVRDERAAADNADDFDEHIRRNISMLSTDPLQMYPTVNIVWDRFNKYFEQVIQLLFHAPIMKDYYRQALEEFRADNVQYIELRGQLAGFNDENGTVRDAEFGADLYKEVTDEFIRDNPDFSGAKIIMSGLRFKDEMAILEEVKMAMHLHTKYPNFMMGYDLVGQEDPLKPLLDYIDVFLYPQRQNPPFDLPYFFHAGETNWQETAVDYNLVDAILLNTTRIGHGYALIKHPDVAKAVKDRGIAVEVNPLSNQLLGLVSDLRNHAITPLLADNFPIVISSDDPGTWEAAPLSHDIYVAFMDMSGEETDLTFLKQLAINSIKYSAMTSQEKQAAMTKWQDKWNKFITEAAAQWGDSSCSQMEKFDPSVCSRNEGNNNNGNSNAKDAASVSRLNHLFLVICLHIVYVLHHFVL